MEPEAQQLALTVTPICGSAETAGGNEVKRSGGTDRLSGPLDRAEQ